MYSCIREDTVALEYALLSIDGNLVATRNNGRTTVLVSSFFSQAILIYVCIPFWRIKPRKLRKLRVTGSI